MKKKMALMGIGLGAMMILSEGMVWASPDAGAQLNQDRTFFERQQIERQMEEELMRDREGLVEQVAPADTEATQNDITFVLSDIVFDESTVLTAEELDSLKKPYLHTAVTLKKLYRLVDEINALYEQKGYVVCRAGIAPQTIKGGVVKISLLEGKTGFVTVTGNDTTDGSYITDRLPLEEGKVVSLTELSDDVIHFNGTNDVQLRVRLKAGHQEGTTDYEIFVFEPEREVWNLFTDNAGSKSSGEWRGGLSYYNASMTGHRDSLQLGTLFSDGVKSGSVRYGTPVGKNGQRIDVSFAANSVHTKHGALAPLDVRGHSSAMGLTYTIPIAVTKDHKAEASFAVGHQNSKTNFKQYAWIDDSITSLTGAVSFTDYGKNSVFYHSHSYSVSDWENIESQEKTSGRYNLTAMYQKLNQDRSLFTMRFYGQAAFNHYLASSEQFYIGGVYSVRGYDENYLSADSGLSLNLEYRVPDTDRSEWVWFADGGIVLGHNQYDDHTMASIGGGYTWKFAPTASATVLVGVPLERDYNGERIDAVRVHAMANYRF